MCSLLSRAEIATAQDKYGESIHISLINNQRCVDVFKYLSCSPPYSRYRKPLIPKKLIEDPPPPVINEPDELIKPATPTSEDGNTESTPTSIIWRPFVSDHASTGPVLSFGEGVVSNGVASNEPKLYEVVDSATTPPAQTTCKNSETCFLHGIDYLSGYDLVHNTFMNWPAQVTTVLGFHPFVTTQETTPTMISVQNLDCFVKKLLVSNENSFATAFLFTLSRKINKLLTQGVDIIPIYEKEGSLEGMNETNLPMYVGVRYLGALVRTLALEHSRVKGTLVELPPARDLPDRLRNQEVKGKLVHDTMK